MNNIIHIRVILTAIALLLSFASATAQTVVWQMKPSEYNDITRINSNLYKVSRNGKIGLISADGSIIAPVENDQLSLYHENIALMTSTDGTGERVTGCLNTDGKYTPFTKRYYVIPGQNFYSDGLLSVKDENGNPGYIDKSGNQILGFNGEFSRIKPFAEGYATVFKNKKYTLIDKEGSPVKFRFRTVGKVTGGTNVLKGKAYVYDQDGRFYSYSVDGSDNFCKEEKKPKNTATDYLYRFTALSGLGKEPPYSEYENKGTCGLSPTNLDGRFGFEKDEKTILSPQLSFASQFEDNLSIAGINGKLGILKLIENETFNVSIPSSGYKFYSGDNVECRFILSVPPSWRGDNLNIIIKDDDGTVLQSSRQADNFTFSYSPSATEEKNFTLLVIGESLKLFEQPLLYSFTMKKRCPICRKDLELCPGHEKKENSNTTVKKDEPRCKECGKLIKDCEYAGVH